jgi:hypothetical protein
MPEDPRQRRRELSLLDRRLDELETAHEQGQVRLTHDMALRLSSFVGGIAPGMSISDAMHRVFQAQQRYLDTSPVEGEFEVIVSEAPGQGSLASLPALRVQTGGSSACPLDEAAARSLTMRIREATRVVCLLLLEAHQQRAWSALGYESWTAYVHEELGMSRSRSYELLDHARVIRTLQAAADTTGVPELSPYMARQIKPRLDEVVANLRKRLAASPERSEPTTMSIILSAVEEQRRWIAQRAASGSDRSEPLEAPDTGASWHGDVPSLPAQKGGDCDLTRLRESLESLGAMPPPGDMADLAPGDPRDLVRVVQRATRWLAAFADELTERCSAVTVHA